MICSRFVFFVFEGNPEAVPEHETILSQLDEETNPQLAYLDDYNSQTVKQRAMNNVNSAFHAHQQKAQQFDSSSPTVSTNPLDKPKGMSVNRIVELQCAKSIGSLGAWTQRLNLIWIFLEIVWTSFCNWVLLFHREIKSGWNLEPKRNRYDQSNLPVY